MTKEEINLAKPSILKYQSALKIKRRVNQISIFLIILFLLVSFSVFGLYAYYKNRTLANERKISQLGQEIKKYEKTESYLTIISDRVKFISNFFKKRSSYEGVLEDISSLLGAGLVPEDLRLLESGGLSVKGSCQGKQTLEEIKKKANYLVETGRYKTLTYTSVSKESGDIFKLDFSLQK